MIIKDVILVSKLMISSAISIGFEKMIKYRGCVYQMMERLGDEIMSVFPQYLDSALHVWKSIIEIFISEDCYGKSDRERVDNSRECFIHWSGYDICNVVRKIYEIDPTYEDPFGVAKELRKNEKFITCPKCGKVFRERESACPECGCTKQEIEQIEEERRIQAEKEAEERRIQAEKEAEEARARAEQEAAERAARRKEWWQKNKTKVIVIIIILLCIISAIICVSTIQKNKSIAMAEQAIASGDSCVVLNEFDKAEEYYIYAGTCSNDYNTQVIIYNKKAALRQAREDAVAEYNEALRRLKIYLEADDYIFNKYSNQYLDKMIELDPERKETIYYQNLRKQ
jgi:tetratricopeptide (TPR) repeat protein